MMVGVGVVVLSAATAAVTVWVCEHLADRWTYESPRRTKATGTRELYWP